MRKFKSKEDNKVKYGTISLPLPLISKIKKRIVNTGISSVSGYIAMVMRDILSSDRMGIEKDTKRIKERLKILGY